MLALFTAEQIKNPKLAAVKLHTPISAESVLPRRVGGLALRAPNEVMVMIKAMATQVFEFAIRQGATFLCVESETDGLPGPGSCMALECTRAPTPPPLLTLAPLLASARRPCNPSITRWQARGRVRLPFGIE